MTDDMRSLLERAAGPRPDPLDFDDVVRRARRRTILRATTLVVLIVGLAAVGVRFLQDPAAQPPTIADPPAPGLVAHYPLEDGFGSSVAGAPALEPVGDISLVDDDDPSGAAAARFGPGSGLTLDASSLISPGVYTVAMRLRLDEFDGWSKLIDLQDRRADDGFYAHANALQFWRHPLVEGRAPVDEYATVVLRRDTAGTITWFVDGEHAADVDDADGHGVIDPLIISFFLDDTEDQDAGVEETSGRVAWISIYDRALPDATITDLPAGTATTAR